MLFFNIFAVAFDFVLNRAFLDYIDNLYDQESVKKFLGLTIFALKATNVVVARHLQKFCLCLFLIKI